MHVRKDIKQPLHVSGIFVAHRQEVYSISTTIGTCCAFQLTVCWLDIGHHKFCVCVCVKFIYALE